jgi:hypothetical protein
MYFINHIDGGLYKGTNLIAPFQSNMTLVESFCDDNGNLIEIFEECILPHENRVPETPYKHIKQDSPLVMEPTLQIEKKPRGRPRKERRNERAPTKYNVFIRGVMSDIKKKHPNMSNNERLKECARLWHAQKQVL